MKNAKEFLLAAHANTMNPDWCATRLVEVRASVNAPGVKIPQPYRTWLVELLSQLDSEVLRGERAVQAVIDHYEPPPAPAHNVFPAACPRCLQRGADCLCPPLFPDATPF